MTTVIFDLDGTLLDTAPDFSFILDTQLARHGREPLPYEAVHRTVSSGARALVQRAFDIESDDARLPALLEEFLAAYAELIPSTRARLFDDIAALLSGIEEGGRRWAIMTNKARRFSEPLLTHFPDLARYGSLVCPDDVNAAKPDPAGILRACSELGVDPGSAVYVGDHPRDIEAAINAGMPGIAVRWGYLPEDANIDAWGAAFIADTPSHLADYLELTR